MDKQKKKTVFFCKRIGELQRLQGYSTNYVMENLFFDDGEPVIKDRQLLNKYKSGDREPQRFEDTVRAFAKFYDVTTDYLLGLDDTPNPQIKSVQDFTGLSDDAVKGLVVLKNTQPDVLAMVDALLTSAASEHITLLYNLYQQIYDDYQDIKEGVSDSAYDMTKMHIRFLLTQRFYEHLKYVVINKLTPRFDNQMLVDADWYEYRQSQEYFDTITNLSSTSTPDDSSNE